MRLIVDPRSIAPTIVLATFCLAACAQKMPEKQCGSIDDHKNQEAQFVVQYSQVDLQKGCEEEQSVEDQWDELDETHCKDVAEENKAGENLNCDDLINIFVCVDVTNNNKEKVTKFEEELKFLEAWLETPCLYESTHKLQ